MKAIIQSVEGLTSQTYDEIQRLPIGVALISGASIQIPILVEIRTRETDHGGKSVTVFKDIDPSDYKVKMPKMPPPPSRQEGKPVQKQENLQKNVTEKAIMVNRVAKRLGWVTTNDPDETIRFLSAEAQEMKENVYKYLESLAQLGNNFCHKENPSCLQCPMATGCRYHLSHSKKSGIKGQRQGLGFFKREKQRTV